MRLEILVEERSMEVFLRNIIPKIVDTKWILDEHIFIRPHEGKNDLLKSISVKTKVYSNSHEPITLLILYDQDSNDCKILKEKSPK